MKTLTKFINEKLIINQRFDEKLIINQRFDEKLIINQRFDEKLVINKDYNYTKEKNIFEKMINGLMNVLMH